MHQSFLTTVPTGPGISVGIAGLKCHALSSVSSPQCMELRGFDSMPKPAGVISHLAAVILSGLLAGL